MSFDITKALSGLKSLTDHAKEFAGPLAALGVPYAGLINAGLGVAQGLEKNIADGTIVATSEDHEQVKTIITDLQASNDELARQVDAS